MRKFQYNIPGHKDEPITVTVSEQYIMDMYYPWWYGMMKDHYPEQPPITEDCIKDFMIVNWAIEL